MSVKLPGDVLKWADIDREAVEFRSVFQPRACYLDFQLICSMICQMRGYSSNIPNQPHVPAEPIHALLQAVESAIADRKQFCRGPGQRGRICRDEQQ